MTLGKKRLSNLREHQNFPSVLGFGISLVIVQGLVEATFGVLGVGQVLELIFWQLGTELVPGQE